MPKTDARKVAEIDAEITENHASMSTICNNKSDKTCNLRLIDFAKSITYFCDFTRYDGSEIATESM